MSEQTTVSDFAIFCPKILVCFFGLQINETLFNFVKMVFKLKRIVLYSFQPKLQVSKSQQIFFLETPLPQKRTKYYTKIPIKL